MRNNHGRPGWMPVLLCSLALGGLPAAGWAGSYCLSVDDSVLQRAADADNALHASEKTFVALTRLQYLQQVLDSHAGVWSAQQKALQQAPVKPLLDTCDFSKQVLTVSQDPVTGQLKGVCQ
jgi:hypothetical protein